MQAIKSLLAISVLAAAGVAHSATVGTYNVAISGNAYDWVGTSGLPKETSGDFSGAAIMGGSSGTGTATLDDSGTLTIQSNLHFVADPYPSTHVDSLLGSTTVFTGTYSGGVFTVTGGSITYNTCSGFCDAGFIGTLGAPKPYDTTFGGTGGNLTVGSINLATGGVATGDLPLAGGSYEALHTYTLTTAPAVPVPAAAWLFGSGLLGLAGTARRRSA